MKIFIVIKFLAMPTSPNLDNLKKNPIICIQFWSFCSLNQYPYFSSFLEYDIIPISANIS